MLREEKRKDYAFRRQFIEKPSITPGCQCGNAKTGAVINVTFSLSKEEVHAACQWKSAFSFVSSKGTCNASTGLYILPEEISQTWELLSFLNSGWLGPATYRLDCRVRFDIIPPHNMTQVWELRLCPCTFRSFYQYLFLAPQFQHSVQVTLVVIGSVAEYQ